MYTDLQMVVDFNPLPDPHTSVGSQPPAGRYNLPGGDSTTAAATAAVPGRCPIATVAPPVSEAINTSLRVLSRRDTHNL